MPTPTLIEEILKEFDTFIKESESLVKGMTELYGTPTDLPTHYTKSIKSFLSSALTRAYDAGGKTVGGTGRVMYQKGFEAGGKARAVDEEILAKKAYDAGRAAALQEALGDKGSERRRFYQMGYDEGCMDVQSARAQGRDEALQEVREKAVELEKEQIGIYDPHAPGSTKWSQGFHFALSDLTAWIDEQLVTKVNRLK